MFLVSVLLGVRVLVPRVVRLVVVALFGGLDGVCAVGAFVGAGVDAAAVGQHVYGASSPREPGCSLQGSWTRLSTHTCHSGTIRLWLFAETGLTIVMRSVEAPRLPFSATRGRALTAFRVHVAVNEQASLAALRVCVFGFLLIEISSRKKARARNKYLSRPFTRIKSNFFDKNNFLGVF